MEEKEGGGRLFTIFPPHAARHPSYFLPDLDKDQLESYRSSSSFGIHQSISNMSKYSPMITIRNSSTNLRTLKTFSISVSCLECQAGWSLVEKVWQAQPRRQNLERRSKTLTTQCIDRNVIIFFTKLLTFNTNLKF